MACPRLSRSATVLLEELKSFGKDRVIESPHLSMFLQSCRLDFSDRFYLILSELRMKGYIERVGDGYRVVHGRGSAAAGDDTPGPLAAAPASRGSALPMKNPWP